MKETDAEFRIAVAQIIGPNRHLWDFGDGLYTVPVMGGSLAYERHLACFIVDRKTCKVLGIKVDPPDSPKRGKSIDWTGVLFEALKRGAPLFDEKAVAWKPGELLPTDKLV
jgi:hypothetical protein